MELMMFFFLFALAMGRAQECSEERAESCIENLLGSLLGDTSEEEVCGELKTSITCLRNAVDECLEEEDEEVEEGLKELEKVLKENCEEGEQEEQEDEEDEKMKKCFEENEDYVYECIYEGSTQALSLVTEKDVTDENALQCSMYSLMADCFVERVGEKCGDEAGRQVKEEMDDLPTEIALACEAAGDIEQHSFELIDKKKK